MGRNKTNEDVFDSRNFTVMTYNLSRKQKIQVVDFIRANTFSFSEARRISQESIMKILALKELPNQKEMDRMTNDAIENAEKRKELN